jgi:hypothetical protein
MAAVVLILYCWFSLQRGQMSGKEMINCRGLARRRDQNPMMTTVGICIRKWRYDPDLWLYLVCLHNNRHVTSSGCQCFFFVAEFRGMRKTDVVCVQT